MGVTRFLPARLLGLSTTAEARTCYEEWAAELLESGVMKAMPAEVCTHLVPFVMGRGDGELPNMAKPQPCREIPVTGREGGSPEAHRMQGIKDAGMEGSALEGVRSPVGKEGAARVTLRSVRGFTIPPQSEMGPIPVKLSKEMPHASGEPL